MKKILNKEANEKEMKKEMVDSEEFPSLAAPSASF